MQQFYTEDLIAETVSRAIEKTFLESGLILQYELTSAGSLTISPEALVLNMGRF
ncbi:hypothetical protein [Nitrosovibrio tenuis]|uniref:hypothetical protein n=1 Tax=Nitrosovibrio tenuis TaxID=1233 RepID=UPI0015A6ADA1|nr:hypothetical protein [Nitrosovibrio tenuis]